MASFFPLMWLCIGILAAVTEGFTVQLVSIWFALSAAVTAVVTLLVPMDFSKQLLLFSILGLVLLLITRPFVKRKMTVRKECTNADMVVGKTGKMVVAIDDTGTAGRVLVIGMEWAAKSANGMSIAQGNIVCVRAIEGATLLVELAENETLTKS